MTTGSDPAGQPEPVYLDASPWVKLHVRETHSDTLNLLLHEIGTNLAFGRIALLSLDLQGDRKPVLFVSNDLASAAQGQFSPDGQPAALSRGRSTHDDLG